MGKQQQALARKCVLKTKFNGFGEILNMFTSLETNNKSPSSEAI